MGAGVGQSQTIRFPVWGASDAFPKNKFQTRRLLGGNWRHGRSHCGIETKKATRKNPDGSILF